MSILLGSSRPGPARVATTPPAAGVTAERIECLRSLLLEREALPGARAGAASKPAFVLGQWRN